MRPAPGSRAQRLQLASSTVQRLLEQSSTFPDVFPPFHLLLTPSPARTHPRPLLWRHSALFGSCPQSWENSGTWSVRSSRPGGRMHSPPTRRALPHCCQPRGQSRPLPLQPEAHGLPTVRGSVTPLLSRAKPRPRPQAPGTGCAYSTARRRLGVLHTPHASRTQQAASDRIRTQKATRAPHRPASWDGGRTRREARGPRPTPTPPAVRMSQILTGSLLQVALLRVWGTGPACRAPTNRQHPWFPSDPHQC